MHAKNEVIMPVLGMNQDTGKIVRWLIDEGQPVKQGEPLFEVETDKAVAEIEAPASGILSAVTARLGEDIPVGQVIAVILPEGQAAASQPAGSPRPAQAEAPAGPPAGASKSGADGQAPISASPLAARMAAEHHLDLARVRPQGGRVEKADVLAYIQSQDKSAAPVQPAPRRPLASPKARRLAAERGLELTALQGRGPGGAVLAADVPVSAAAAPTRLAPASPVLSPAEQEPSGVEITPGSIWRIMAEHTAAAWSQAPHFFLMREVDASRITAWRESILAQNGIKVTYNDLLVKLAAAALRAHPRLNAVYQDNKIRVLPDINIGIAVAVDDGLVVPVIHKADELSLSKIAATRADLVEKAHTGRLRPQDISDGTFTITNLGMYGVDAFLAVINTPQSAILAVGRIAERVVPFHGQAVIRPMLTVSLSFDHRSVDGARGAQFLDTLAKLIEEPLGLIS